MHQQQHKPAPEALANNFVAQLRALFDVLDHRRSGRISLAELATRWRQLPGDRTRRLPPNLLSSLAAVATPCANGGSLTFDRFLAGVQLALHNHHQQQQHGAHDDVEHMDECDGGTRHPHPHAAVDEDAADGGASSLLRRARSSDARYCAQASSPPPPPPHQRSNGAGDDGAWGRRRKHPPPPPHQHQHQQQTLTSTFIGGGGGDDDGDQRRTSAPGASSNGWRRRRPPPPQPVMGTGGIGVDGGWERVRVVRENRRRGSLGRLDQLFGEFATACATAESPSPTSAAKAASNMRTHGDARHNHLSSQQQTTNGCVLQPLQHQHTSAASHSFTPSTQPTSVDCFGARRYRVPATSVLCSTKLRQVVPPSSVSSGGGGGGDGSRRSSIASSAASTIVTPNFGPDHNDFATAAAAQRRRRLVAAADNTNPHSCRRRPYSVAADVIWPSSSTSAASAPRRRRCWSPPGTSIAAAAGASVAASSTLRLPSANAPLSSSSAELNGRFTTTTASNAKSTASFSLPFCCATTTTTTTTTSTTPTPHDHSYPEEFRPQVAKHERLLAEEVGVVARGAQAARELVQWYAFRAESLEKRQRMLSRGMVALDTAVHEQRLNVYRALVAELNRRIKALIASSDRDFPISGGGVAGGVNGRVCSASSISQQQHALSHASAAPIRAPVRPPQPATVATLVWPSPPSLSPPESTSDDGNGGLLSNAAGEKLQQQQQRETMLLRMGATTKATRKQRQMMTPIQVQIQQHADRRPHSHNTKHAADDDDTLL